MANIKINFNPNGAGCKHVHLMDSNNKLLEVTTEAAISAPVDANDSHLVLQVKREMESQGLTLSDKSATKTALESTSFDVLDSAKQQGAQL